MTGVDTNVLVRHFAKDDPVQAAVALAFLTRQSAAEEPVRIGLVVIAELAWVLQTRYGATRAELAAVLDELLIDPNMHVQDEAAVAVAAHDFATSTADFADTLIAAVDTLYGCRTTLTFDQRASRLTGMTLLQ